MGIMKWFMLFAFISFIFHKIGNIFYYILKKLGLTDWWDKSATPLAKKTIINLVVGLGIMMVIVGFQNWPWMIEAEDASMDWMMELNQKIIPAREGKPPFVFLDVDDKTFSSWGEPLFTPRNKLKNLIATAVKAEPKIIIVDIDASQPTPILDKSKLHPEDQELKDYLENYAKTCDENCSPIVLARAFKVRLDDAEGYPEPRVGFLEDVVNNGFPHLQWASAHFFHAEDMVIRRWMLWQPACTANKEKFISPSFELVAMSHIREDCNVAQMQEKLQKLLPKKCDKYEPAALKNFELCGLDTSTDILSIHQRVDYKMPWLSANDGLEESNTLVSQIDEDVLTIFSAEHFAKSPASATQENLDKLKDSIVVIGGSYRDARDTHITPLEEMPGALVIINAINTLLTLDGGTIKPLGIGWRLLMMAGIIVILSFILVKVQSAFGMMLSGMLFILILLVPAVYFYGMGIWLDFTIPLLMIQLYQMMSDFEELRQMRKKNLIGKKVGLNS
ncbi:CHASE2 domain-containing protein [Candidatus Halobeggiatoa sp. HSG11]|nr:CHASE2 domain-containing protein [Candidatus Halobeggiatoa sp. HSG11]